MAARAGQERIVVFGGAAYPVLRVMEGGFAGWFALYDEIFPDAYLYAGII
jgi:hypothetical protein